MSFYASLEDYSAPVSSEVPSYVPSPTAQDFILATALGSPDEMRLLILSASRGEGKTTAAVYACLALADRLWRDGQGHLLPLKVACVRDTWTSIIRTTLESLQELQRRGLPVEWRDGGKEAVIAFETPMVHFFFFGVDTPGDVDKLQGFACGVLWLEEVAPAAGLTSGIPQEIFGVGATSVRQAGVPPRILVSMNPPDKDAWILHVEEYLQDLGLKQVRVARFNMPPGEKDAHFRYLASVSQGEEAEAWGLAAREFEAYRIRNKAFLESIGRTDLVARLVEGQTSEVQVGEAVVPMFSREMHVAREALPAYPSLPLILNFDGGGSPSCCVEQDLPNYGGVNVLGSHTLENASMEALIRDWLLAFMSKYHLLPRGRASQGGFGRGPRGGYVLRAIGDPSLLDEGKTTRAENVASQVIYEMLHVSLEPGPVEWAARREALHMAYNRAGRGNRPRFIQIDPTENDYLIRAAAGRFAYPRNMATGKITMTIEAAKKHSGVFAQAIDAHAYGLAVRFPAYEWLRAHQQQRTPRSPVPAPKSWVGA